MIRTKIWKFVFKLLFFLRPDLFVDKLHKIVKLIIFHKKKNQYKIPNEVCFVSVTFSFISFLEKAKYTRIIETKLFMLFLPHLIFQQNNWNL